VRDWGVLPRSQAGEHPLSQSDNTWNLLFIANVSEQPVQARVTFHKPDGSHATAQPLTVPPHKSILECLHGLPWLGTYTAVDEPFALAVTVDGAAVPEICGAEFEMWSQVCPGAMSSVNFYPGPLDQERTWWLGIGRAGGADDRNVEWLQSYHLFNPGDRSAHVTLTCLGLADCVPIYTLDVPAGGVALLDSTQITGLPVDTPFAVRVDSDVSICAQLFVRTFTRGRPDPRAMYSVMGVPMPLAG
jgi:hypothetical protein